ncbi:aspartic peptidase domain-containing protein [Ephemerocybe angulata]|uniref:Aspartic peptidase domain-containing protein n=1 Tax=Ephemerocybe angulata TaxID=980116 RepID=A0A8H6H6Q3_9AGAR|nr:aspartic peptidase domain-containing protein [Tulosesus angulatus]
MTMLGGGVYDANYVLPVTVGRNDKPQTFLLQVDTGSSDLWIASTDCTSSECSDITSSSSSTNSVASSSKAMYDPGSSGADSTGADFTISYLQGDVSGPVYWDKVQIGGYGIENQAVAAAASVASEPLSPAFHGILGLALPLNSVIAQSLPPVTSNDPDGAAWASNLFSITPVRNAPARRFVSMLLSRPESDRIPSLLGIGRHPAYITSLPDVGGKNSEARVEYDSLVAERSGTLFWKTGVRAVTVYVQNANGETETREVKLPRAVGGGAFPSAVVDSGVPVILARSQIANAIWGAVGIGPAEDGMYYIPCTTPLNLTITLDGRSPISLHPLDLTALPPLASPGQKGATCVGLIQSADAFLGRPNAIGDMILGVPFLRNVYSVMGYVPPKDGGVFENPFTAEELGVTDEMEAAAVAADGDPTDALPTPKNSSMRIQPRLGLLGLTDPTVALDEFHSVRVLNQPISSNNGNGASGKNPLTADGADGRKGLSVGIIVLISLISFFALCFALFGLRFWMMRRRYNKAQREPNSRSGASTPRPPFYVAGGGGGGGSSVGLSTEDLSEIGAGSAAKEQERKMRQAIMGIGGDSGYELARIGTRGKANGEEDVLRDDLDEEVYGNVKRSMDSVRGDDTVVVSPERDSKVESTYCTASPPLPSTTTAVLPLVESQVPPSPPHIGGDPKYQSTSTFHSPGAYESALQAAGLGLGLELVSSPPSDFTEPIAVSSHPNSNNDDTLGSLPPNLSRHARNDSAVLPPGIIVPRSNSGSSSTHLRAALAEEDYRFDSYYEAATRPSFPNTLPSSTIIPSTPTQNLTSQSSPRLAPAPSSTVTPVSTWFDEGRTPTQAHYDRIQQGWGVGEVVRRGSVDDSVYSVGSYDEERLFTRHSSVLKGGMAGVGAARGKGKRSVDVDVDGVSGVLNVQEIGVAR